MTRRPRSTAPGAHRPPTVPHRPHVLQPYRVQSRYSLESRAGESLGSSAGTQVQGILEAAEATAADN